MENTLHEIKRKISKPTVKKIVKKKEERISISSELIAKKAYELFERRGFQHGYAEEDWLEAKRILEAGE